MLFIPLVVQQHAEEAAFLWLLRDAAVRAPHYLLADLARLDGRVEAHLDGLRVNGDPAWETCSAALGPELPGELFAAGVLAFEGGQEDRIQKVLAVGAAKPVTARAVISALGWLPYEQASGPIESLLEASDPASRRIGIAAAAIHRQDPKKALTEALASPDPALRRGPAVPSASSGSAPPSDGPQGHGVRGRGLPVLGGVVGRPAGRRSGWADDPPVGRRGGRSPRESGAATGHAADGLADGEGLAEEAGGGSEARPPGGPRGRGDRRSRIDPLADRADGGPRAGPGRRRGLRHDHRGATSPTTSSKARSPKGSRPGPPRTRTDENVAMDPDEDLPWPDPDAISKWWEARRGDFSGGTRYLVGRPIEPGVAAGKSSATAASASGRRRPWSWRSGIRDSPCSRCGPPASGNRSSSAGREREAPSTTRAQLWGYAKGFGRSASRPDGTGPETPATYSRSFWVHRKNATILTARERGAFVPPKARTPVFTHL